MAIKRHVKHAVRVPIKMKAASLRAKTVKLEHTKTHRASLRAKTALLEHIKSHRVSLRAKTVKLELNL